MSWWLSGSIDAANCIAAYCPVGAADLAASYTNLANPGTYDCTVDSGKAPSWNSTDGWICSSGGNYVKTGITPAGDGTWSAIIRFIGTAANSSWVFGSCNSAVTRAFALLFNGTPTIEYHNTNSVSSGNTISGVHCMAGSKAYFNGSDLGVTLAAGSGNALPANLYIGTLRYGTGTYGSFSGSIQAFAVYNTALTSTQVSALTTAMNGLPEASGIAIPVAQYYYNRLRRN